jgi:hypothetical protein
MPAAIEQRSYGSFAIAAEDDGPPGDGASLEVAGVFELRGMADVDPAAVENGALFALEHVVGDENLAIDEKRLLLRVFDDKVCA